MEQEQTVPPQVEPVSPAPQVPNIKNSLVLIMSILLIVTVAIAGLFYFQIQKLSKELSKYQIQPSPTPVATTDPTANWKTYINTSAKYSIKYPPHWKVDNGGLMEAKPADALTKYVDINYQPDTSKGAISLTIEETLAVDISQSVKFDEEKTIGSELAKCGTANDSTITFCWLKIPNQSKYLVFVITKYQNSESDKSIDQILSTFKFLGQNDQILGIQINKCCSCPTKVSKSAIGTDGWVIYERGKDYSGLLPETCDQTVCAPCPPLEEE